MNAPINPVPPLLIRNALNFHRTSKDHNSLRNEDKIQNVKEAKMINTFFNTIVHQLDNEREGGYGIKCFDDQGRTVATARLWVVNQYGFEPLDYVSSIMSHLEVYAIGARI
jgi:hypothetical protein